MGGEENITIREDRRLIEDYLPIQAISAASRENRRDREEYLGIPAIGCRA